MAGASTRSIVNILKSPCQVAHNLNWRKCRSNILSVRLARECIELAVASHPDCYEPVLPLPSIPVRIACLGDQKLMWASAADELRGIVDEWQICGMVVSWPVREAGRCGAACGRVLRALDQIAAQDNGLFNPSRLVCLWDERHQHSDEDIWGRAPELGVASRKTVHIASREQYTDRTTSVVDVWDDYRRVYWPEMEDEVSANGWDTSTVQAFNSTVGDSLVAHDDEEDHSYKNAMI